MVNILSGTDVRLRRRLVGVVTAVTVFGVVSVSALAVTTGAASAAGTADISVSQRISGGAASGQTIDTVTVHNAGSATANSIEAVYLLKSTATHGYTVHSSTTTPCQIEPAPPGFLGMVTCPLGSLASGHSVVDTLTWTGTPGAAFAVTASIGAGSPVDPKFSNNTSTISSYFGPRADLRLAGTLTKGTKAGTAVAVTTVRNVGPNPAAALQEIIEIKTTGLTAVHATASTPSASCQFVPAASGYNKAVACVTNSLGTGAKWVLKITYSGAKGAALTTKSSVSANSPIDPVAGNDSQILSTHLRS